MPQANVLGEVDRGFAIANDRLSRNRIPYAASCIGVAVQAQTMAIAWSRNRERGAADHRGPGPVGRFVLVKSGRPM